MIRQIRNLFTPLSLALFAITSAPIAFQTSTFVATALPDSEGSHGVKAGEHKFMGTGSCSSSNCHGSASPRLGGNILFNEYVTWQRHDKHAGAYRTLESAESALIAKHLGLTSATSAPLCLSCHATPGASNKALAADGSKKLQLEDGVTCETCHGAAEGYLTTHTAAEASHKDNIANGMRELAAVETRASLCLSCHYGSERSDVTHRLIGAGHPRLAFELDTFENIMPRHWEVDADYAKRKYSYRPTSAWMTAQAIQAESALTKALSPKRSKQGMFPDFSLYYCYSCHHSLEGDQWKTRDYAGQPGEPQMNLSSVVVLKETLKVTNPKLGKKLEDLLQELHSSSSDSNIENKLAAMKQFIAASVVPNSHDDIPQSDLRKVLKALAKYSAETQFLPYEVAEQLAMGIVSIAAELKIADSTLRSPIDTLYSSLKKEEAFAPEQFTIAAKQLVKNLGQ